MKVLQFDLSNGSTWQIPATIIARHRARYYAYNDTKMAENHPEYRKVYDSELECALSNDKELIDWAENNMDWVEVKFDAVCVKKAPEADFQEAWINSYKLVVENPNYPKA